MESNINRKFQRGIQRYTCIGRYVYTERKRESRLTCWLVARDEESEKQRATTMPFGVFIRVTMRINSSIPYKQPVSFLSSVKLLGSEVVV